jgi:hypothetical protein
MSCRLCRCARTGLASLLSGALALLLALPPALAAQQATGPVTDLAGAVVDARDGSPVAGAVVRVPVANRYTLSGEDGRFTLRSIPGGMQEVSVHRIGYQERTFRLPVEPGLLHLLEVEPAPILLEGVEGVAVHDLAHRILDSAARVRASGPPGVQGEPIFWSAWDREEIEAAGIDEPRLFLTRGPPRLIIRPCVGLGLPADRLCVSPPFAGMRLLPSGPGVPSPVTGLSAGRGRGVPVFLDGHPMALEDLDTFTMELVHRVETYGDRGEQGIRLYTQGYLRLVAEGLVQPGVGVGEGAPELFDDLVREQQLRDPLMPPSQRPPPFAVPPPG